MHRRMALTTGGGDPRGSALSQTRRKTGIACPGRIFSSVRLHGDMIVSLAHSCTVPLVRAVPLLDGGNTGLRRPHSVWTAVVG
jgi:hypothetical protein